MKKSKLGLLAITLSISTMLYAQGNYVPPLGVGSKRLCENDFNLSEN